MKKRKEYLDLLQSKDNYFFPSNTNEDAKLQTQSTAGAVNLVVNQVDSVE